MKTKIIESREETPGAHLIRFQKPANFSYQPGQFISVNLPIENPDERGTRRSLSLASAPTEDFLQITTRHGQSSFKKTLHMLPVGTEIDFVGPLGHFFLNQDAMIPAIFLAGGIGITPFRNMLTFLTDTGNGKKATLLFSNKTESDIVFREQFKMLERKNKNLTVLHTITDSESLTGSFSGFQGRITKEMIQKVPYWIDAEFYLCGPIPFVSGMRELVSSLGIANDRIKSEQFSGY